MKLQGSCFSPDDCAQLHEASLQVMEQTGVKVLNARGRDLLKSAGASIIDTNVRIPRELVAQALAQAPSAVPIYDRCGKLVMDLQERSGYFGAGGTAPFYHEAKDGVHRPFTLADCARLSHICDACEQISFDMAMAHCTDVPVPVRDLYEVATMIRNSPKPIVFTANSPKNVSALAEIFRAASDGQSIVEKPYGIFYDEPISPLVHGPDSLEKVWLAVDAGFPLLYTPAPMAGATGPATLAGNLVVGNVEWLSGLVMTQLHKPGAPVIYGGVFANLDYSSCIMPYASPELLLQTMAVAEMGHFYHIPSFGTAGCTDSSAIDLQSGFDEGLSILLNLQSGANLIHDVGWMASANVASAEQLVITNEMIAFCRRLMQGITVDADALAVEVIASVGPEGTFLAHDHTMENFRRESFFPTLWDRRPMGKRQADDPTFAQRAVVETARLLQEHTPIPMTDAQINAVDAILAQSSAEAGTAVPDWTAV